MTQPSVKANGEKLFSFINEESVGGLLLMVAAVLALLLANSPLAEFYAAFFQIEIEVRVDNFQIQKPMMLWINDGLMAIFFFTVGLELKREVISGELSNPANIAMPAFGAVGGMLVPAAVYYAINKGDDLALQGWAIPTATDIAFALGVLTILGSRVPTALKMFLVALAIVDDIGAIIIIAIFYTADVSQTSLALAISCAVVLFIMNRCRVESVPPYILVGVLMWMSVLKSGVHATLAGVVLAMFIPANNSRGGSPLRELEHNLHPTVAYAVLPLFALANCGVPLAGVGIDSLMAGVPLGIALGLVVGKPVGVLMFCGLAAALKIARLPEGSNILMFAGAACLTGIGFTMSLFIGSLAFEHGGLPANVDERLGILLGSVVSALIGFALIKSGLKRLPVATGAR